MDITEWIKDCLGITSPSITVRDAYGEADSLEHRIRDLLDDVGADTSESSIRTVRSFLDRNCLEVTGE